MKRNRFTLLKRKLTTWRALPLSDKVLFVEAAYFLGIARIAVAFIPFKHIAPTIGTLISQNELPTETETDARAIQIAHAIARAVRYTPWKSVCLPQAIAVQRMLERRGLEWNLYLGVAREEEGAGLKAHAWLQNGSKILCGAAGHQNFTVVSVFSSGSEVC